MNSSPIVSSGVISVNTSALIEDEFSMALGNQSIGVDPNEIEADCVTLVGVAIDASGSMQPHKQALIDAYNKQFIEPLKHAKNANEIFVSTMFFSDPGLSAKDKTKVLHGYMSVADCPELRDSDFVTDGMTPLNDGVFQTLSRVVKYGESLLSTGARVRSIVVVFSDGAENASSVAAYKVKAMAEDLLKAQEFILSYVFFGDQNEAEKIISKIGFPKKDMITANQTASDIRRMFGTVSASVIKASQSQISSTGLSNNNFFQSGR
jgi:uncharacterized protein YegL